MNPRRIISYQKASKEIQSGAIPTQLNLTQPNQRNFVSKHQLGSERNGSEHYMDICAEDDKEDYI
jgi:hypothetical protein